MHGGGMETSSITRCSDRSCILYTVWTLYLIHSLSGTTTASGIVFYSHSRIFSLSIPFTSYNYKMDSAQQCSSIIYPQLSLVHSKNRLCTSCPVVTAPTRVHKTAAHITTRKLSSPRAGSPSWAIRRAISPRDIIAREINRAGYTGICLSANKPFLLQSGLVIWGCICEVDEPTTSPSGILVDRAVSALSSWFVTGSSRRTWSGQARMHIPVAALPTHMSNA